MLSQMYYYTKIMQAPVRDTPGKVVDLLRSSFSGTTPQDAPDAKSDAKLETPMERATIGGDYRQVSGSTAVGVGTDSQSRSGLGASCGTAVLGLVLITLCASSTVMAPSSATGFTAARRLLDNSCASTPAKAVKITGTALGWTSAAIYLNSRLPQVCARITAVPNCTATATLQPISHQLTAASSVCTDHCCPKLHCYCCFASSVCLFSSRLPLADLVA